MSLKWGNYNTAFDEVKFNTKSDRIRAFRRGMNMRCSERVEGFGALIPGSGGDKTSTNITNKLKMDDNSKKHFKEYMENVKEDINEEITKSMNNVVTSSTVDVMTKNENVLKISSLASNIVSIRDADLKSAGDVKIAGNLKNKVDVQASSETTNDVVVDINMKVSKKASDTILNQIDKGEKLGEELGKVLNNTVDKAAGVANNYISTAGDVANNAVDELGGAFNNAVDVVGGVANTGLKAMFGAGSRTSTNVNTDKQYTDNSEDITEIERINRDIKNNKQTINLEQMMDTTMNKHITNEFLSECKANSTVSNAFIVEKLKAESTGGDVKITPELSNNVSMVLNCYTNNTVTTKISTEVLSEIENKISDIFSDTGTLEAMGGAMSDVILSAGSATSEAAQGLGKGTAIAAEGAGNATATAGMALQGPLMIAAGVGMMILLG
jgi:hypothetical protein